MLFSDENDDENDDVDVAKSVEEFDGNASTDDSLPAYEMVELEDNNKSKSRIMSSTSGGDWAEPLPRSR